MRYLTAIRHERILPDALRDLIIMRVAQINGAPYEAEEHAPMAPRKGLTRAQADAMESWPESHPFDVTYRAVLAYCNAMTRHVHLPADVSATVRAKLNKRELVKLTATIGAYTIVSRFLDALEISSSDDIGARR